MRRWWFRRALPATIAGLLALAAAPADATRLDELRLRTGTLYDFPDDHVQGLAITLRPDDWPQLFQFEGDLRYEIGVLRIPDVDRGEDLYAIHFAPGWRYSPDAAPWVFVEGGVGLTLLSGHRIRGRYLGSRLNFIPQMMLAFRPGADSRWYAGLRIRHTSNAYIVRPNPGFDAVELEIGFRFSAP